MSSKRDKLLAYLAPNSGASEGERDNARRLLARMDVRDTALRVATSDRMLSRNEILQAAEELQKAALLFDIDEEDLRAAAEYFNTTKCRYCGSPVRLERVAKHESRCPHRHGPRYVDGQRVGRATNGI